MNPHPREETLFAQALELNAAGRAAFLDRECGSEPALRERIERLLAAHAATAFLPQQPRTIAVTPADLPGEQPGERLGRYKLLEKVGEGGCGVVYVAEQIEPVRRRVALKVIKLGMDTQSVVARFEAERQALALMDHPNIAKVLDAGATERGRPYFVMELVRGIPITAYCDQNQLGTTARIGLFIQVCQAVQHAHQKGIIHRDLKPSNILVTVNDGAAVPKVIDFGIAKATEGRLTDATIYTQLHQFIGTPAYMSPEQAEMTSLDIDTRSDIYSLGVLLYELLAGRTPFEAKELLAAGLDALRKVIREQEPARPSTKLATLQGEELSTTAKRRATEPPKLLRQLQGDLDWIVMKCLEKDRTRRYETANGLAADLQRHLSNEPVVARPPSTAYRLQKAWQRHRPAFAVAALVAAVLVAATAFSGWQARKARLAAVLAQEAQEEATARAQAERTAREEAEALVKFLGDVFRSPDPGRDGRTITVAETLAGAAHRLETELAGQPARRALLQTALAETYQGLSLYREAEPLWQQVLAHHRQVSGPEHTNTVAALASVASARYALGHWEEAVKLHEEVVTRYTRLLGREHPATLKAMSDLAHSYARMLGREAEAARLMQEVVASRRNSLGPDHVDTKKAELSLIYVGGGTVESVAQMAGVAAAILEQARREKGPNHPDTIQAMSQLAFYTPFETENAGAEKIRLSQEALEAARRVFGPEHETTLTLLGNLGWFQLGVGQTEAAIASFEEVIPRSRKTYSPDHLVTLNHEIKLAEAYSLAGRMEEAIRLGEDVLMRVRQAAGDENSLGFMQTMAQIYTRASRQEDADRLLREAHEILLRHSQEMLAHARGQAAQSALTANAYAQMGFALDALDRGEEAIQAWLEAVRLNPDTSGKVHYWLGKALLDRRRYAEALPILYATQKFHPTGERAQATADRIALAEAAMIQAHLRNGHLAEAEKVLEAGSADNGFNTITALNLATLQLWFDETEAYGRLRGRLLDWAMGDTNLISGERMAKLASLQAHASPAQSEKALTLARRAVEQGAGHELHGWFLLSLGIVEHRAGLHAAAAETLVAAEQAAGSYAAGHRARIRATARLYRALSVQRQGQPDEALALFLEGEAFMKEPPAGTTNLFQTGENQNDVIAWLAYREAAVLLLPPDDETLRARRADIRQRFLAEEFSKDPPDTQAGITLAALQLWTGDASGYVATRDRLLQWAVGNDAPRYWERERVAKVASLQPGAPASVRAAAVALARQAVEQGAADHHLPWYQLALGMAEFRNGNHPAAAAAFDLATRPVANEPASYSLRRNAARGFYLAISLHDQGRAAEALAAFRAAEAQFTPPANGAHLPVGAPERDQMILLLAHREAKALLGKAAPE